MIYVLVALLLVVAAAAALLLRRGQHDRAPGSEQPAASPLAPAQTPVSPSPLQTTSQEVDRPAPAITPEVSWDELDSEAAVRPQVDAELLRTARANVSREIPDDVLEEMLFQATPQQTAQLLSGVSSDIMADLTAGQKQGVHVEGQARAEDLAALSSLSSAVDDLDIWDFGEESSDKIKA